MMTSPVLVGLGAFVATAGTGIGLKAMMDFIAAENDGYYGDDYTAPWFLASMLVVASPIVGAGAAVYKWHNPAALEFSETTPLNKESSQASRPVKRATPLALRASKVTVKFG